MATPDDILTLTDIVLKEDVNTKVRRRCYRVEIETAINADPTLSFHQQDIVEISGEAVATTPVASLVYPFSTIQTTMRELTDPVTGQVHRVSLAFIAQCIKAQYVAEALAALAAQAKPETP